MPSRDRWQSALAQLQATGFPNPTGLPYISAQVTIGHLDGNTSSTITNHGWLTAEGAFIGWNGLRYRPQSPTMPADLQRDLESLANTFSSTFTLRTCLSEEESLGVGIPLSWLALALLALAGLEERIPLSPLLPETQLPLSWQWAHYDRAIGAHRGGRDQQVADDCQWLLEHYPEGPFAKNAQWLLTDAQRRLQNVPTDLPPWIAVLEDIDISQGGQSGVVLKPVKDHRVQALIDRGVEVVPDILHCLEHDRRLTRAVAYSRNFNPDRTLIWVSTVAFDALPHLLYPYAGIALEDDPAERALAIARDWQAPSYLEVARRWYAEHLECPADARCVALLTDPDVPYERRLDAARWLVTPKGILSGTNFMIARLGPAPLRGERYQGDAQVTQGFWQGWESAPENDKVEWLIYLQLWNPELAIDEIRAHLERVPQGSPQAQDLLHLRLRAGDTLVAERFWEWLLSISPAEVLPSRILTVFNYPLTGLLAERAEWLFTSSESPWQLEKLDPALFTPEWLHKWPLHCPAFHAAYARLPHLSLVHDPMPPLAWESIPTLIMHYREMPGRAR